MKTKTGTNILKFIEEHKKARVHGLALFFQLSPVAIHKQIKKLLEAGKIEKIGKPPLVFYRLRSEKKEMEANVKNSEQYFSNKNKYILEPEHSYKNPVFLFTSSSLRKAAFAGWFSALGDREETEKWIHAAHAEWSKELGAGRGYSFLNYHSYDIWAHVPKDILKSLVDKFLKDIKKEIKKAKKLEVKQTNNSAKIQT